MKGEKVQRRVCQLSGVKPFWLKPFWLKPFWLKPVWLKSISPSPVRFPAADGGGALSWAAASEGHGLGWRGVFSSLAEGETLVDGIAENEWGYCLAWHHC